MKLMDKKIYCLCCFEAVGEINENYISPKEALIFSTTGNYGSKLLDCTGNKSLLFIICDSCVIKKKHLAIAQTTIKQPTIVKFDQKVDLNKMDIQDITIDDFVEDIKDDG